MFAGFLCRGGVGLRDVKERKLLALMVRDLGVADLEESEVETMRGEVQGLSEEELDRTLSTRLDLPYPVDGGVLERALNRVEEPERLSKGSPEGFTGAPDHSHAPRPEEREQ